MYAVDYTVCWFERLRSCKLQHLLVLELLALQIRALAGLGTFQIFPPALQLFAGLGTLQKL